VIPKIGQTCPELRTVFALSLCFVSLSGERNEKSPPYGKEGTGEVEPRSAAAKIFGSFSKKNNRTY
jgi:hypothetical protein